jgi:hypothetical protein
MGISQVPPVPTPVVKGDIVVGTATGPTRLPVGTTANQALLVDSTTATGLKYGATTLTTTQRFVQPAATIAITGFSYVNPNITFTTATPHGFSVGQYVAITGVTLSGTTGVSSVNTSNAIVSVPSSTTFTWSHGATTPSSYLSGGFVTLYTDGEPNGYKFLNNTHIFCTNNGGYMYSTDTITWNYGQLPISNNAITAMEWDGTTYVFGTNGYGIWTSSTLAYNSWTRRSTFNNAQIHDIRWCAGSTNRLVAVGSNNSSFGGTGTRIEYAAQGGVTWTAATLTGTNSYATMGIGFDGVQTLVGFNEGHGPFVSTNGGLNWTGYADYIINTAVYYRPSFNPPFGWYNSNTSRWHGFSNSWGYVYGTASSSTPSTTWNKHSSFGALSIGPSSENGYCNRLLTGTLFPDLANNRFFSASSVGGVLTIVTWDSTPVSVNANMEYYTPIGVTYAPNFLNGARRSGRGATSGNYYVIGFGGGKWLGLIKYSTADHTGGYNIYVAE